MIKLWQSDRLDWGCVHAAGVHVCMYVQHTQSLSGYIRYLYCVVSSISCSREEEEEEKTNVHAWSGNLFFGWSFHCWRDFIEHQLLLSDASEASFNFSKSSRSDLFACIVHYVIWSHCNHCAAPHHVCALCNLVIIMLFIFNTLHKYTYVVYNI